MGQRVDRHFTNLAPQSVNFLLCKSTMKFAGLQYNQIVHTLCAYETYDFQHELRAPRRANTFIVTMMLMSTIMRNAISSRLRSGYEVIFSSIQLER